MQLVHAFAAGQAIRSATRPLRVASHLAPSVLPAYAPTSVRHVGDTTWFVSDALPASAGPDAEFVVVTHVGVIQTLSRILRALDPTADAGAIGRALQRRGARWVADVRDAWTFEPLRQPFPLGLQDRLDHALERRCPGLRRVGRAAQDDVDGVADVAAGTLEGGGPPRRRR